MRRSDLTRLRQVMALLPDERADALSLRFFSELSLAEVAQVMDKSEAAVKMLIYRGLARIARSPWAGRFGGIMNENFTPAGVSGADGRPPDPLLKNRLSTLNWKPLPTCWYRPGRPSKSPPVLAAGLKTSYRSRPVRRGKERMRDIRLFGRPVSSLGMMMAGAVTMTLILLLGLPPAAAGLANGSIPCC